MSAYAVLGDWGTSRLRLYRVEHGVVVDRREGPGVGASDRPPEAVLRAALADWRRDGPPGAIRLCGMVGSRNGWVEAPYLPCPAGAAQWREAAIRAPFEGGEASILPGLEGAAPLGAPEVMRGEETQIFGALALEPDLARGEQLIVLPGTHSKWARLTAGRVVGFQTFLTGEVFALLRDHSMLARLGGPGPAGAPDAAEGFRDGLARARGGQTLGALFEARAAQLLAGRSPAWALEFLSGLLIGREIAEGLETHGGQPLTLIGDPALTQRYGVALEAVGAHARRLEGEACVLAGLDLGEAPT
jgi:2-dehydro-3-deoxygalactonokinase